MNRKPIVLLVAFLTLAPLAAQNPVGTVQRVLQLDEDQAQQLSVLVRSWREAIAPLRMELRELLGHSRELLGDPDPDPAAIGVNQLAIQQLRREIAGAEAECRAQFEALLNPGQLETYARIRRWAQAARRYERIAPSFRALGLLGGTR
jgi:hypothetical protein